jgi:osmotically-inducible protein OsmY
MTLIPGTTDHDLKTAITDELAWTPNVNADQVGVAIADGAVTLSGQVATYPEKQAAVSAALRVRGVLAVVDDITVVPAGGPHSDADVAREVQRALQKLVTVPADAITVTVHDHVVTLAGTVAWQHERRAAQRAVSWLPGVNGVHNLIALAPPVAISPVDAQARITAALVRNARLDAEHVHVAINGTEVRLTGTVSSWAERHQAEYAGWATPGVTHVDNRLVIGT